MGKNISTEDGFALAEHIWLGFVSSLLAVYPTKGLLLARVISLEFDTTVQLLTFIG
jgi:hypothetical protein